jgi:hypothetical protein
MCKDNRLTITRECLICRINWQQQITKKLTPKSSYFLLVFAICMLPRIILLLANKECNDDHMTPVLMWQEKGEFPETHDCWECFQPPFFYFTIKTLAAPFRITTWQGIYTFIQFFNLFFVTGILWLLLKVVESLQLKKWLSISLMLFWGMNPELISIGTLATNDTVLIFFGFIISYLFIKHWHKATLKYELPLVLGIAFLGITKGNALVFGIALVALFGLEFIRDRKWNFKLLGRQALSVVFIFFFVGYFGSFFEKQQKHGNAFTINQLKQNSPNLFEEDTLYDGRKGVTTVFNSYFKLRFASLIEMPYNLNSSTFYPIHRTSFWGQMFGQFSNYTFERYPASWVSENNDNFNFSRVNYCLHLPLFLFMLFSLAAGIYRQIKQPYNPELVHLLLIFAFTFFVARYSYIYRDFSNMKVIFIYPVLYSIITLFGNGSSKLKFEKLVIFLLLASTFLYQINFIYLIRALIP